MRRIVPINLTIDAKLYKWLKRIIVDEETTLWQVAGFLIVAIALNIISIWIIATMSNIDISGMGEIQAQHVSSIITTFYIPYFNIDLWEGNVMFALLSISDNLLPCLMAFPPIALFIQLIVKYYNLRSDTL